MQIYSQCPNQTLLSQLDPQNLSIIKTWTIPCSQPAIGFAFLMENVLYIGCQYNAPRLHFTFDLRSSEYLLPFSHIIHIIHVFYFL